MAWALDRIGRPKADPRTRANEDERPDHHEDRAEDDERDVPLRHACTRMDVVKPEQSMIDETLDDVERAPADEQRASERSRDGELMRLPDARGQDDHAGDRRGRAHPRAC